jgi:hypothetical protein
MSNFSNQKLSRRQFIKRLTLYTGGAFLTGAALVTYPVFIERYLVRCTFYQITVPHLPPAFEGLRIAHLTDLHFGRLVPLSFIQRVVNQTNRLGADVIVCTGDYVHDTHTTESIDLVWPVLAELKAPMGVYAVLGNHDHWADFNRSLFWLRKSGQDCYKKAVRLERRGDALWLGGAGDAYEDDHGIDATFASVPDQACKICLAHNPDTVDETYQTRVDLFLCGHTHGGQIWMPIFNRPFSDAQLPVQNKDYVSGFIRSGHKRLFISRGIGWAVLPIRFNCPPEIAVLELTAEPANAAATI